MTELGALVDQVRKEDLDNKKFMASLQGVDITKGQTDEEFRRVQRQAQARITGKTEEEIELAAIGIAIETV